jgi:hypothetical protein
LFSRLTVDIGLQPSAQSPLVMAGLDPAIHVFERRQDVDARHKAGHDDEIKRSTG